MRRLLLAAALPVLAGAACDARHGTGASPFPAGGRFLAERAAGRTTILLSSPAWATYCPADSLLVIVSLSRAWNAGLALRTIPPLDSARDFQVQIALGDIGTATAAFRSPKAGDAKVAVSGTVHVAVSSSLNGRFDVALPDSGRSQVSIRGTLSGIPFFMLPVTTCSPP